MKFKTKLAQALMLLTASVALAACAPMAAVTDDAGTEAQYADEAVPAPADALPLPTTPSTTKLEAEAVLKGYQHLDPSHVVPTTLLEKAVVYFDANKSRFSNQNYIAICDFKKSSATKRFFIINMKTGAVKTYYVAHGSGSDTNHDGFAEKFSNVSGSNMSSLGFYRTAETYSGKHGYSLRLDGLSTTNSKVRSRAIVIHGADYVSNAARIQGRTNGCFGFAMSQRTEIIDMIKTGALLYAAQSN